MSTARPSALARLEALLRLVDDVHASFAPHEAVVAVAVAQGLQRVTDFHGDHQWFSPRERPTADKFGGAPMPQRRARIKSLGGRRRQGRSRVRERLLLCPQGTGLFCPFGCCAEDAGFASRFSLDSTGRRSCSVRTAARAARSRTRGARLDCARRTSCCRSCSGALTGKPPRGERTRAAAFFSLRRTHRRIVRAPQIKSSPPALQSPEGSLGAPTGTEVNADGSSRAPRFKLSPRRPRPPPGSPRVPGRRAGKPPPRPWRDGLPA